jgi:uncharacterized membrane protein YecN with MAPEG domain
VRSESFAAARMPPLLVPATGATTSALTLLVLRATFDIIALRRKHQVPLGDGGHADLAQAIRAHANLVEFAPLGLLGLGCLELNGVPSAVVGAAGALFFCGRLLHYRAMHVPFAAERARHIAGRVRGMQITLVTLGATAAGGLCWTLWALRRA